MDAEAKPLTVIVAEDDADDRFLIEEAFARCDPCDLTFVEDGEQLLNHLRQDAGPANSDNDERRRVIVLDLNMPRMNGHEALQEIKSDPALARIPVVVFTTSGAEEDIVRSYDLGVNSFIMKPVAYGQVISALHRYWSEIVTVPG